MNDREKKLNEIKQKYINIENEEEEEDKEGSPLSIEEIDNVSMVKPKETV